MKCSMIMNRYPVLILALLMMVLSCQKEERPALGDYPKDPDNPGGILKLYMAFEDTELDSIRAGFGTPKNITYDQGIHGKALKGATDGWIEYPSPSLASDLKSFTVSFWINTSKHDGGAQNVFMIPNTGDFWGNMFMLIEGNNGPTDSMLIKFHFAGQWIEFLNENRLPNMYGAWRHLVFTYDTGTSKFYAYLDGAKLNLPPSMTDRQLNGAPLGDNFSFKNVSKFIIGGYQQHLGSPWSTPEAWMLNYTGLLDQFRVYGVALSDAEISELHAEQE